MRGGERLARHVLSKDPRVRHELCRRGARVGALREQVLDQPLRLRRDALPLRVVERHLAGAHVREDRLLGRVAVGVEGVEADEQNVHQHADGPHVDGVVVRLLVELLGRPVRPRADPTARPHLRARLLQRHRRAKVDELDRRFGARRVEDDILGLDVAVDDPARVEVVDRARHLLDDARGELLRVRPLAHEALEEAAARRHLHHQVDLAPRVVGVGLDVHHLEELDDVGVAAALPHREHLLLHHRPRQVLEAEHLHRHLAPRRAVDAQPHVAEAALAEPLLELVPLPQLRPRHLGVVAGGDAAQQLRRALGHPRAVARERPVQRRAAADGRRRRRAEVHRPHVRAGGGAHQSSTQAASRKIAAQ